MTEQQAKDVVDAIDRMFSGNVFSICTVEDCMKITNATPTKDYSALRLYHSDPFITMDRDTQEWLFRATVEAVCNFDDFAALRLYQTSEETERNMIESQQKRLLLKRLFRR